MIKQGTYVVLGNPRGPLRGYVMEVKQADGIEYAEILFSGEQHTIPIRLDDPGLHMAYRVPEGRLDNMATWSKRGRGRYGS